MEILFPGHKEANRKLLEQMSSGKQINEYNDQIDSLLTERDK